MTNQKPILTIITVTFNNVVGLGRTLDSLRSVSKSLYSHVIIDGGSSDSTVAMIDGLLMDRVDIFISEADEGIYDAMNKGVEKCTTPFLTFLNAGDEATPHLGEAISRIDLADPYDFYYGSVYLKGRRGFTLFEPGPLRSRSRVYHFRMPFPHPGSFFRKSLFQRAGTFDTRLITADHEWILRILSLGVSGRYIELPLVTFYLGGKSSSLGVPFEIFSTCRRSGCGILFCCYAYSRSLVSTLKYRLLGFLL